MQSISKISSGIRISVQTILNMEVSLVDQNRFFYNYHITIENINPYPVCLLKRHWEIFDSLHELRVVDGDGVVGLTPVIQPNEKFSYSSGCDMFSEVGFMKGYYTFERLDKNLYFEVEVPKFDLIFFGKLN